MAAANGTFSAFLRSFNAQLTSADASDPTIPSLQEIDAAVAALADEVRAITSASPVQQDDKPARVKDPKARTVKKKDHGHGVKAGKPTKRLPRAMTDPANKPGRGSSSARGGKDDRSG